MRCPAGAAGAQGMVAGAEISTSRRKAIWGWIMLFLFAAMAGGFALIFRGIEVIGCRSVSLSRHLTSCYPNDFGAMSGPVAGGGLIAVGAVLFGAALIRFATVR